MTAHHTKETLQLAEQAAEWVTRLDDEPSQQCRAELVEWLRSSPRHIEEFLLAQATYRSFHELGAAHAVDIQELLATQEPNVVSLPNADEERTARNTRTARKAVVRRWPVWSAATAGVAIVAVAAAFMPGWFWRTSGAAMYTTAVGEQRTVRLSDGSLLSLNTNSKAQISFGSAARQVELLKGEALFEVVRDPGRPFQVSAGNTTIHVLGTQFNVQRRGDRTRVSVIDGRIRISTPQRAPTLLSAGEEVSVAPDQSIEPARADVESILAWRQRRLVFHGTPLADVVDEFNRYNERPLRLESSTLAQRRISGVFHADDPNTILKFLERESALQIDNGPVETVIRERQ